MNWLISKKPRMIIDYEGNKAWENKRGHLHRTDGPAVICITGTKKWFVDGLLHRDDGPAIEWADGDKEWWLSGFRFFYEEEWKKRLGK